MSQPLGRKRRTKACFMFALNLKGERFWELCFFHNTLVHFRPASPQGVPQVAL